MATSSVPTALYKRDFPLLYILSDWLRFRVSVDVIGLGVGLEFGL